MYNSGNIRPQGQQMQQPPTASELQAKEKLTQYVYEYLVLNNFTKSAESFKQEVLPNSNLQVADSPGFLTTWFCLFWDLYSGDPERRDKCNPTQEAKAFHDFGFVQGNINGMRPPGFMGPPGMPMPPPGSDGMMPQYYRPNMQTPYGNRPPGNFPPNGPSSGPPMFANPNDQMRGLPPNRMRIPPPNSQFQNRPPRYGGPGYMESPNSNPQGFQMQNGNTMHQSMNDIQHDPRFIMSGPPPTSMPQYMGGDQIQQQMTPTTSVPNSMNINPMPPPDVSHSSGNNNNNTTLPPLNANNQQIGNIINGEEIKQSPSHMMHPPNGTPGSMNPPGSHPMMSHGGPGSVVQCGAPPSVQSQPGQPGSNIPVSQQNNPQVNQQNQMMDHNIMEFNDSRTPSNHDHLEIKKIREGLLNDFDDANQNQ